MKTITSIIALCALLAMTTTAMAYGDCVQPDFRNAEQTTGISEMDIKHAMGPPGQGPPDFSNAAKKLGISKKELMNGLGIPKGASLCPPGQGQPPGGQSNYKGSKKGGPDDELGTHMGQKGQTYGAIRTVSVHGIEFKVNYTIFNSFDELPNDITMERQPIKSFTRPEGGTHYYEAVYVPTKNVSWVQAAKLAESEGGYLASITSSEENKFVFSLVDDEKFFWEFPDNYTPDSHYNIKIGPFLGGTKTDGSTRSRSGWVWLSGEEWDYTRWCRNLDDGRIDRDPRPNDQPNGRGKQNVMGFGEMNVPVETWGDYFQEVAQYKNMTRPAGHNYGFVIEYKRKPNRCVLAHHYIY
ncbi:MAG: hypothetical protein OCC46_00790 [Pseudodesulfovibrio sp.]